MKHKQEKTGLYSQKHMPTKRRIPSGKYYFKILFEINLIKTKNITKVVVKPLLKNDSPIIKNHLITSNIKAKQNFQRKCGNLSQQVTTQKLPGKMYKDAPLLNVQY